MTRLPRCAHLEVPLVRRSRFLAALAVVLGAGATLGVPAQSAPAPRPAANNHVARPHVAAKVAAALGPNGEMRGVALNNRISAQLTASIVDFPRMAAEGITSVTAYVYLYVDDPHGTTVSTGTATPTDAQLQLVMSQAKASGLSVHLMPVLLDHATDTFRGYYTPSSPAAFFASYTTQLNHYADLAQANGVTLLFVGSENDKIAGYTAHWRTLIASVRRHYSGALSYMSTGYAGGGVRFWDALDLAAISPYYSLGNEHTITYQRLMSAWNKDHLPYLARLAKAIRKPLVFGEIGYVSRTLGYNNPSSTGKGLLPAPTAQQVAYRALLDAVAKSSFIYGMTLWYWDATSSPLDTNYSPKGKPAECTLAQRWSTNATVLSLAALPVCDLGPVDAVTQITGL
jgi:hypothetical protein